MKKNMILKLRISEDVAKKLAVVSKNEKMTIQNELISMIRQKISYYERVKGNITRDEAETVDLSEYESEE